MSCLKPHYARLLSQFGTLSVAMKTEAQIKEIIQELNELGFKNLEYRCSEELPTFSAIKHLNETQPKPVANKLEKDWIIQVRTVNEEVK